MKRIKKYFYHELCFCLIFQISFINITYAQLSILPSPAQNQVSTKTHYIGKLYEKKENQETKHIYLGNLRVASITNGEVLYYHEDHLGSTNVVTDANGIKKEIIEYHPFGTYSKREIYDSDDKKVKHTYTGQEDDEESELYFYGARYYHPEVGRFIQPDSIVPDPNNPQELNRYSYVLNNPINRIDPTGHFSFGKFLKSFLGGIVSAFTAIFTPQLVPSISPIWTGTLAGALGSAATAGTSGTDVGLSILQGGAVGLITGGLGVGISNSFGNVGRQIYDSSVVIAGGINGATHGNTEGFLGGVAGSGLITGIHAVSEYNNYASVDRNDPPQGFWETAADIAAFANSIRIFNKQQNLTNGVALFADGLALLAPGVPAVAGAGVRAANAAKLAEATKKSNSLQKSAVNIAEKLKDNRGFARIGRGRSAHQINRLIQTGKAPKTILRVDGSSKEMLHVHFSDKTAIYSNGVYKHGNNHKFTNSEIKFLKENGFKTF